MSVPEGISEAMASSLSPSNSHPHLKTSISSSSSSSTTSPSPDSRPSLTQAINTTSRPYHTHLNRTLLARLPLALPPHTSDPTLYALGIRHLLPIYHAFETEWAKYVSVEPKTPTMEDFSMEEAVMLSVLIHLNLPALARTDRLRQDVAVLLGVGMGELDSWTMKVGGEEDVVPDELEDTSEEEDEDEAERYVEQEASSFQEACSERLDASCMPEEEDLGTSGLLEEFDPEALVRSFVPTLDRSISSSSSSPPNQNLTQSRPQLIEHPALHSFLQHIREISAEKPHVLIAYGWVLYMALFNGGRWIRAQLQQARPAWGVVTSEAAAEAKDETGLSFWFFDGAHDGEDLKDEFKARMRDVEAMLTEEQAEDVVREAGVVFRGITRLVEELDEIVGGAGGEESPGLAGDDEVEAADPADYGEEPAMIRSELMRPRWETPIGYLVFLFQVLLPVGLWEVLMVLVRTLQGSAGPVGVRMHWPVMRWAGDESGISGQDG